jgi:hypothetical protein
MTFKLGVLIIGSLYWDKSAVRDTWRKQRLDLGQAVPVKVPIRYGRKSGTRGDTFTMVFSRRCYRSKLGIGLLVPCRAEIGSGDDLILEARKLWNAERNSNGSDGVTASTWGAIGLLANPNRIIPDEILALWKRHALRERSHLKIDLNAAEGLAIRADGMLDIRWPLPDDDELAVGFDMVLATVTVPTITKNYPTAVKIANKWIHEGYEEYFFNNVECGIRTFQDEAIWKRISQMKPEWRSAYSIAIEKLRRERNSK